MQTFAPGDPTDLAYCRGYAQGRSTHGRLVSRFTPTVNDGGLYLAHYQGISDGVEDRKEQSLVDHLSTPEGRPLAVALRDGRGRFAARMIEAADKALA